MSEAAFDEAAKVFAISPQTLRRYLAAAAWLGSIERSNDTLAEGLKSIPMAAVEHLARLHRRDPDGAIAAARSLLNGNETVRSFARISAARPPPISNLIAAHGRKMKIDYREYLIALTIKGLREVGSFPLDADRVTTELPVDFEFSFRGRRFGLLIVGPYRDGSIYVSRASDWCLKALGLVLASRHRMRVLLCVPSITVGQRYEALIRNWMPRRKSVYIANFKSDLPSAEIWDKIYRIIVRAGETN